MTPAVATRLPKVSVLTLGGTIASTDSGGGAVPSIDGRDLVAAVPDLATLAALFVVPQGLTPSCDMDIERCLALADAVAAAAAEASDGVVITHGTDTLEETAFALDVLCDVACPVVLTGAMRSAGTPGADGPANLLAAIRVASDPAAAGRGVLVVLQDEIHAARSVRKVHTSRLSAFQSPDSGLVGWVVEDRVRFLRAPERGLQVAVAAGTPVPVVSLHRVSMGDDGRVLAGLASLGVQGLVVEGLGGGHVPSRMVEVLQGLAAAMPVILASRTGSGDVLRHTYGYPGSETDLIARGLIPAGALDGLKARILLTLLLAAGRSRKEIEAAFSETRGES